ncbi:helix-turn-helix transcriptional regulator [Actinomadura sp. CNU-125]|uniref:helix-turn-helix transcriptional regulator n=1 Tax=Actinomadura sp. CNU-125 TaxID=1904961 RepID=UPI0021CC7347|nr:WYL domain-containing protein [Actinomadura sp. CNU-125]
MSAADSASAHELAERVRFLTPDDADAPPSVPSVLEEAVSARRVVRLGYVTGAGDESERDVEPVAFTCASLRWYLIGWCRLRDDTRIFRIDRIRRAALLDETAPERRYEDVMVKDVPLDYVTRRLEFV